MNGIRRLAVLTSGGDCPGLNACIRAVVRMSLHLGVEPWGVRSGFAGLMAGELDALTSRSVSHIIGRGGSILGSSRSAEFSSRGLREAQRNLNELGIDALVVIGGDGSMRGAQALSAVGFPVIGVPATIENDVWGTDMAIGVDTALNTALDALDRIKDTASSHQQAFLVGLAGEKSGYLTLMTGLAGGAEVTCIPEVTFSFEQVAEQVADAYVRGKQHCIIVVSEGAQPDIQSLSEYLSQCEDETGFDVRLAILGHVQRGGTPSAQDRFLGTQFGSEAVRRICEGNAGVMVALDDGELVYRPLADVATSIKAVDPDDVAMAEMLAR